VPVGGTKDGSEWWNRRARGRESSLTYITMLYQIQRLCDVKLYMVILVGKHKERDHLEVLGVDGKIIL